MATLKLVKAKTGTGFPPNTTADFRFDDYSMAVMTFPQINTWKNFPANTTLNFSVGGNLELFIDGELEDTCPQAISISPETNGERTLSCGYGAYTVIFNVT